MAKPSRKRKNYTAPLGSTREKGDIVEEISASIHRMPGVQVDRNVFLPVIGENREREIDVLLTSHVAGYPVRIAIECKNEKKPIGVAKIDEFIGKLQDVGIPTQSGIFISGSKYTNGAISRARKAGIRPLLLQDTDSASLEKIVSEAFQSTIYLLLTITQIQVHNDVASSSFMEQMLIFQNQKGKICGSIPDLVWQKWIANNIPAKLGTYKLSLEIPDGWYQVVDERPVNITGVNYTVN